MRKENMESEEIPVIAIEKLKFFYDKAIHPWQKLHDYPTFEFYLSVIIAQGNVKVVE